MAHIQHTGSHTHEARVAHGERVRSVRSLGHRDVLRVASPLISASENTKHFAFFAQSSQHSGVVAAEPSFLALNDAIMARCEVWTWPCFERRYCKGRAIDGLPRLGDCSGRRRQASAQGGGGGGEPTSLGRQAG
jgi:hypothetical protein